MFLNYGLLHSTNTPVIIIIIITIIKNSAIIPQMSLGWFDWFNGHRHSICHIVPKMLYILSENNGGVVAWCKMNDFGVHVKSVSLLVASYGAANAALTVSPLTTGATSRGCSGLILTPGNYKGSNPDNINNNYNDKCC